MTVAVLTLCAKGAMVAKKLLEAMPGSTLHVHKSVGECADAEPFERVGDRIAELFGKVTGMVCIMPTGIVTRALAPLIKNKYEDPAVVAMDVGGRWAISLLSGHEGGANDLAMQVANILDAEPIITTTTEAERDLIVGIGCRRGASCESILNAIREALSRIDADGARIRLLASAEIKRDEAGLIEAANALDVPLRLVGHEQIRACKLDFQPSETAKCRVNLPAVAEPAALLSGRRTKLILSKIIHNSVTVAVARENCAW